ncbi:MAG: MFS transporter, partial [Deltaproteobacteria bacterium]|nr:MFS transporter [Deltaproteobacteria bacterium]
MPLALAVGPLLGALMLDELDFASVFAACGFIAVAALFCFSLVSCPPVHNTHARFQLKTMLEIRVGRLFVFMLLLCIGYGGVVAFAPLYAPQVGFDSAAPLFSAWAIGAVLARIPGGRLYDSLGPKLPGLVGLVLLVVGWLALGLWHSKFGMVASAGVLGFGFGLLMPGVQAMAVDLVKPARRGAANATLFSAFDVGIAIGAMGFGQLAKVADLSVVFLISSGLAAVGICVYLFWVIPHFNHNRL